MAQFDVFNGDADGIFALLQLRRTLPISSNLVTGVKRDIELLRGLEVEKGDQVDVLDISLDRNRADLLRLLQQGADVRYWDHHYTGSLPQHDRFTSYIKTDSATCTSLIMNRFINEAQSEWALAGAYGDNLITVADSLGHRYQIDIGKLEQLRQLGQLVNYNSYGRELSDVLIPPAKLYLQLIDYDSPYAIFADPSSFVYLLMQGLNSDLSLAESVGLDSSNEHCIAVILPNAAWSYRVSGTFANQLAQQAPSKAVIVATEHGSDSLTVSVRAPLIQPTGADELCRLFGGGGRSRAGGIDLLEWSEWSGFVDAAQRFFSDKRRLSSS